jgi:hypothetical protein
MEGTNLQQGYAAADVLRKAMLDKRKTEAQAIEQEAKAKQIEVETARKKLQYGISTARSATSPQDMLDSFDRAVGLGFLDKNYADQMKAAVPKQPGQEFEAYKLRLLNEAVDHDKWLESQDKGKKLAQEAQQSDVTSAQAAANAAETARAHRANERIAAGHLAISQAEGGRGKPPAGYQWNQDGTQSFIPGGPADPSREVKEKPLQGSVLKQIQEVRDNASTIGNLSTTFKKEFAGKGVLGLGADMQIATSGNLGVDKDAVDWWKNYRKQAELVERHALFGAALTPTEQASWRSADISPGMNPAVVEKNLKTREALAKRVLENTRQDLIDAGHSETKINNIAGRVGAASTGISPESAAAPKAGAVEGGYLFKGGDPANPSNWVKQ